MPQYTVGGYIGTGDGGATRSGTGSSLGALTFAGRQPNFFDPSFHVPYVNQFSLGFQYELPFRSALEVSYVGNRSYKLENFYDYNEPSLAFRNSHAGH